MFRPLWLIKDGEDIKYLIKEGELIMKKKLQLIPLIAVFVVLMVAPITGLAQQHDRDRGPSCHQNCDRKYHCENRCRDMRGKEYKKCLHECEKEKQRCENKCEKQGYHR
jgi:hypothetical protein